MALNLGDITFGVAVNTQGVRDAINDVLRLSQTLDNTARVRGDQARVMEAALRRQEAASARAIQQAQDLRRAIQASGLPDQAIMLGRATIALKAYTAAMASGRLNANEFSRANIKLDAAFGSLQRSMKEQTTAQRANEAAAKASEVAQLRQEKAIATAANRVRSLSAAFEAARVHNRELLTTQAQGALTTFTTALSGGVLATRAFQNAQIALNQSLTDVRATFEKTRRGTGEVQAGIKDMTAATVLAVGPLSGIGARFAAFNAIMGRLGGVSAVATAGVVGVGLAFTKITQGAIAAGFELDKMQARLEVATGSTHDANKMFTHLADLADRAGVALGPLVNQWAKLEVAAKGSTLAGDAMLQIVEDLTFAAGRFRLDGQQFELALKAIEQMISKGTISTEELRHQLGDQLAGAFNAMARSLGVTTERLGDMIRTGELASTKVLPAFAREIRKALGAADITRVDSMQASVERLNNKILEFNKALNENLLIAKTYKAVVEGMTSAVEFLTKNMETFIIVLGAATAAITAFLGPQIIGGIIALAAWIKKVAMAATILTSIFTGWVGLLVRIALAIGGAVIAIVGLGKAFTGSAKAAEEFDEVQRQYVEAQREIQKATKGTTEWMVEQTKIQIEESKKKIQALRDEKAALQEARSEMGPTRGAIVDLKEWLKSIFTGQTAVEGLSSEIVTFGTHLKRLEEAYEALRKRPPVAAPFMDEEEKATKRQTTALLAADNAMEQAVKKLEALKTAREEETVASASSTNRVVANTRATQAMVDSLEKAGVSIDKIMQRAIPYGQKLQEIADEQNRLSDAQRGARASAALTASIEDRKTKSLDDARDTVDQALVKLEELTKARQAEATASAKSTSQVVSNAVALERFKQGLRDGGHDIAEFTGLIETYRQTLERTSTEQSELTAAQTKAKAIAATAAADDARRVKGMDNFNDAMDMAVTKLDAVNKALAEETVANRRATSAVISNAQAVEQQRQNLLDSGKNAEETAALVDQYRIVLDKTTEGERLLAEQQKKAKDAQSAIEAAEKKRATALQRVDDALSVAKAKLEALNGIREDELTLTSSATGKIIANAAAVERYRLLLLKSGDSAVEAATKLIPYKQTLDEIAAIENKQTEERKAAAKAQAAAEAADRKRTAGMDHAKDATEQVTEKLKALESASADLSKVTGGILTQSDVNEILANEAALVKYRQALVDSGIKGRALADQTDAQRVALEKLRVERNRFDEITARSIEINRTLSEELVKGFFGMVQGKVKLMDFFDSLMQRLLELLIMQPLIDALARSLNSLGGGPAAQGGQGIFGALFNSIFGQPTVARQRGGPIMAGRSYRVGEHGPETFIPGTSGTMLANGRGGGGGAVVNIITPAGMEVEQRNRRSGGLDITDILIKEVERGLAGGKFDGAMNSRYGRRPLLDRRM